MPTTQAVPIDGYENLKDYLVDFNDQRFDLDLMAFDAHARRWSGRFFRPVDDQSRTTRERTGLLRARFYFPVIESTLTLHDVTACRVRDRSQIVHYTFEKCDRTDFGCTLHFIEALDIDIHVEGSIRGDFRERELDQRGYVETWGPIESGIRLERSD